MVQRAVRRFRVFVPVVVLLGLLTTIWTPMPSAFAAPTVTGFSPISGGAGTRVIITGTGFSGTCTASRVRFNNIDATSYVVNSATQITATVPVTTTGKIRVDGTGGGCSNGTSATSFTWTATTYTVTYNGNSNTGGMVPVDGTTPYASGGTVTVLGNTGGLVRTGYVFTNWNTDASGSGTSYSAGNTFAIGVNTILYAQWAITYTVTYNANGATGGSVPVDGSSPYASGATVTVLGNTGSLVKTGNTFANWNTAANGSGTSYTPSASFAIGSNTVLYAQWKAAVIYNGNGATGGTVPVDGSSPYLNGATVTVLGNTGSLVKTGSTFAHWNTAANGSGTSYSVGNTFAIAADTVLYAQWAVITYTVTYNANGATSGTVPVDGSSPYASGATVTVLGNTGGLVRTGYVFANWNTAANGSGTSYAPSATFTIGADTVLYAQWATTYTVTYNGNGRTGGAVPVDGSSPYVSGATVTVLGNTGSMVRTGSTFANWNTAADGSGTTYAPGATFTVNSNTILYALWRVAVTYNANGATGGTVPIDGSSPYANGATVTVLGNTGSLVRAGYTFNNWNTAANGSGTSYAGGNTFAIGADTVLYAQWAGTTYTVTYNGNGSTSGSVPVDGSSPYASGATVTVLSNSGSLVKTGYAFANWNTAANGSGTSYAPSATFLIGVDTILYAQWTATYTVIYDEDGATGGSVPVDGSSPYLNGATVTVLGNTGPLVKTGNTFAGWNTALDGSGTSYAPTATFAIAANMVLYAKWTLVGSYTVTYNANGATGGTVPVDGSSPYANGTTVTVLGNSGLLVRTGYVFVHWHTAADGSGTAYAPADTFSISVDTVLYAQWAPVGSYSVGYNGNGATGGSVPVDGSSPYLSGDTVIVLGNTGSLVRTGYTFAHWNTAANGSGTSYSGANTFNIGADTILYAQWTITYSVFYDEDGATGGTVPVDGSSPYLNGVTVTVLGNTGSLVRTGNTFAGWNTALDGSGTSYAPAATFAIAANMFLYAKWTATITYDGNGATGGTAPVDGSSPYLNGATVTVLSNTGTLVKTGSTFAHWNTAANGSGTSYSGGNTFAIATNTTLFAQWSATTYTLSYNANGATSGTVPVDGSSPYANGATVTVLSNTGSLVKTASTFAHWNTAADGSGTSYSPAATFTIGVNTVLYAQWTFHYTVVYRTGFSTGGTVPVDASSPYDSGATVTVLGNTGSLVRTGTTFDNWNTALDGSGNSYSIGNTFLIGADTLLYAQWRATLTYNTNGATGGSVPVDGSSPYLSPYQTPPTVTVLGNTGSLVKLDEDGVDFYPFANWNTALDGSGTAYSAGNTFTIASNTVLYAQWGSFAFTVTYNANGATSGTVPVDGSSPYSDDATVSVLTNSGSLFKTGYIFAHWNTVANGSGTSYAPSATFLAEADIILYAQWTISYTVIYGANGATGGTVPVDGSNPYLSGSTVTVLGNTGSLIKTDNTFAHWNTAADGSGTSYLPGNTFSVGANTVLYAQWRVTVTYSGNGSTGGSVPVDGSSPYLNGAIVTVLGNSGSLVRTGYTFDHWCTTPDTSGQHYMPSDTFDIAANTVLYAQWAAIGSYLVSYNENGSTSGTAPVDASSPYLSGSTFTVLGNTGSLANTGKTFANWNTEPDGSGTSYAPSATFTIGASIFLYPQWTTNSYIVAYNGNGSTGGSVPVDGSSPYLNGATVSVLGNSGSLAKSGNTFANWNTAANGSGTSYSAGNAFAIGADVILYAQWAPVGSYTIAYNGNGSTGGTVPVDGSSPYLNGATVSVLGNSGSLAKSGNTFANWNTVANGSGTSYSAGNTFAIGADVILYAQWALVDSYTIAYNDNGSTGGTVPVDGSSPYLNGATVSVLGNSGSLVRTGYVFAHWNTTTNGSGTSYSAGNTFAIGASTILYAQWSSVKKTQVRLRVLSSAYLLKVGESATLTAIGGSGSGVIGYVTTTPSICSVSDAGSVRALTAGVCIVEAMKSGDATYVNVLSLPLNLTIRKLVQAPFTLISSTDILSVGDSSTLTTSGGSGDGVIKFSTTTPTYCSVSDAGLVSALVSGNCIVEATKAGNDTYLEVSAWPLYLTIERVPSVPAPTPTPGTTVNGGVLPKTGSPWYNLLALGIGLILLGGVGRRILAWLLENT